jgi:predicted nucleic acid-binding Zn ribbon protein
VTAWDDEGRPSAWTTTTQSEWDAEDRAIVQAVLDLRADTCGGCGQRLSKSLHKDGEPDPKWHVDFYRCTSCKAQAQRVQEMEKKDVAAKDHISGAERKYVVLPVPEPTE